ncbi:MAG: hypothetical protein Q4Q22_03355 [Methanosphaera sp.]|nr:hypothetical protein [Methanosphaera sp.]
MGLIARHIKNEMIKLAVETLSDEDKLLEIIKDDGNIFEIRQLATKQITGNEALKEIIFDTTDTSYTKGGIFDIRKTAAGQLSDEKILAEIVNDYYDENVETKYSLNVVAEAVKLIESKELLMDIADNDYDKEIIDIALEKANAEFENLDEKKLRESCDDDIKVKRMHAVEQITDDEVLFDVAMNAKYLDVREKALSKIGSSDEKINLLKNLILEEKEYGDSVTEYIILGEDDEKYRQDVIDRASNLKVEYAKMGNPKKEKFYNEQCKLFDNQ